MQDLAALAQLDAADWLARKLLLGSFSDALPVSVFPGPADYNDFAPFLSAPKASSQLSLSSRPGGWATAITTVCPSRPVCGTIVSLRVGDTLIGAPGSCNEPICFTGGDDTASAESEVPATHRCHPAGSIPYRSYPPWYAGVRVPAAFKRVNIYVISSPNSLCLTSRILPSRARLSRFWEEQQRAASQLVLNEMQGQGFDLGKLLHGFKELEAQALCAPAWEHGSDKPVPADNSSKAARPGQAWRWISLSPRRLRLLISPVP